MPRSRAKPVREPVQVYLAPDDSDLLGRLVRETGLSKAEILRRGIRSFAAEQAGESPMLQFLVEHDAGPWPRNVVASHDDILADQYRGVRGEGKQGR